MTVKLEVGKTYEREDGSVHCAIFRIDTDPFTGATFRFPVLCIDKHGNPDWYTDDGLYCEEPCFRDLIREHVPPPTLKEVCEDVDKWLGQFGGLSLSTAAEAIHRKVQAALAAEKAKVSQ